MVCSKPFLFKTFFLVADVYIHISVEATVELTNKLNFIHILMVHPFLVGSPKVMFRYATGPDRNSNGNLWQNLKNVILRHSAGSAAYLHKSSAKIIEREVGFQAELEPHRENMQLDVERPQAGI